jgi:hypothetical protein
MAASSEVGVEVLGMGETLAGRLDFFDFTQPADRRGGSRPPTALAP